MLRIKTPLSRVPRHPDAVAEDSTAGKGAARVDGDHAHRSLAVTDHLDQRVGESAFAGAGRAGEPHQVAIAGAARRVRAGAGRASQPSAWSKDVRMLAGVPIPYGSQ